MVNSTVGNLTAASALDGTELYYGVQGGADRKVTGAQIKTLTSTAPTLTGTTSAVNITVSGNETVSGTLGVTGNATVGNLSGSRLISTAVVRLQGYTVGNLPTGVQGDLTFVTDAVAPVLFGTLTGGGGNVTVAFYNGTNWVTA